MDNDTSYLYQLFRISWEATEGGAFVIDLILAFVVVVIIRSLEKKNKVPAFWQAIKKHPLLENDSVRLLAVSLFIFAFQMMFIAPHALYTKNKEIIAGLENKMNEQSPKLDGFIHRILIADEAGTTNSFIFIDASISNLGGTPSIAEDFGLAVNIPTHRFVKAEEINFSDEYKLPFIYKNEPWIIDLKRHQLLSEKTTKSMAVGESSRGWLAYRLQGMKRNQYNVTNVFFTFADNHGKINYATNGIWLGKSIAETNFDDLTVVIPGAENIFYPNPPDIITNWLPPELPPDCSNVIVALGANGIIYSRLMAEISPENSGTEFQIKDLPDFYLQNLDKLPNYSPRLKNIWIRDSMSVESGGKIIPYPVQPFVISNRLYVEVEVPFSNERHKLVMSDDFDPELPIPQHWDRNYSTNYDANAGVYAYEVVNELTNPVLQVYYKSPNEVHVNGIFKVDETNILVTFGDQPQLVSFTFKAVDIDPTQRVTTISLQSENFSEILAIRTNDSADSIFEMITNEFYRPIFPHQRAIFKYPSNRNLGVFNDETNQ